MLLLGGTSAVSASVQQNLADLGLVVTRLGGANRYETAVAVGRYGIEQGHLTGEHVGVATGTAFPDALAMGPLNGRRAAMTALVAAAPIPQLCELLAELPLTSGVLAGGSSAVSDATKAAVEACVQGTTPVGGGGSTGGGGGGGDGGAGDGGAGGDGSGGDGGTFDTERTVELTVQKGTATTFPAPSVDSLQVDSLPEVGTGVALTQPTPGAPSFEVSAALTSETGPRAAEISGTGCNEAGCGSYRLTVMLNVVAAGLQPEQDARVASPSPDRMARAIETDFGWELTDEIRLVLDLTGPTGRTRAEELAAMVSGSVIGGIEGLGTFQILLSGGEVSAAIELLEQQPSVVEVARTFVGGVDVAALPPGDWSDDGDAWSAVRWPFTQIRAEAAWERSTGSAVRVGIVDAGPVFAGHSDLRVVNGRPGSLRPRDVYHATHVAGLACARANGSGLVGAAWGCPILSSPVSWTATVQDGSSSYELVDLSPIEAVWDLLNQPDPPLVINHSMGLNSNGCVSPGQLDGSSLVSGWSNASVRALFDSPRAQNVVFTLAAGNSCVSRTEGMLQTIGREYANVLVVAATHSNGTLARFSNYGPDVDVAAPGGSLISGDGASYNDGLWSTTVTQPPSGPWVASYDQEYGTSMAAPVVAGVAALVRGAAPSLTAVQVADCIRTSAAEHGSAVTSVSFFPPKTVLDNTPIGDLHIINAEEAIKCALNLVPDEEFIWERASTLGLGDSAQLIDCPTESVCYVVNERLLLKSVDSGGTWNDITGNLGGNVGGIFSLSCPSADMCLIGLRAEDLSVRLLRSTDGGASWADVWPAGSGTVYGADCFDVNNCIAVGYTSGSVSAAFRTENGGATWQTITLPADYYITLSSYAPDAAPGVECISASKCFVIATVSDYATYSRSEIVQLDGNVWSTGLLQVSDSSFTSISCGSPTACVAVTAGNNQGLAFGTQDAGSTWISIPLPGLVFGLADVSCGSADSCMIAGGGGALAAFRVSPDGTSVSRQDLSPSPVAITCANASRCHAISSGRLLYATADSGTTWGSQALPEGLGDIVSLDCWSTGGCAALSENAQFVLLNSDGDESRRTVVNELGGNWAYDISCPDGARCVVVGNWGISRTDNAGASWSRLQNYEDIYELVEDSQQTSIDCGSRDHCVVLVRAFGTGATTAILTSDGGNTWTVGGALGNSTSFQVGNNLDCPTALLCWATLQRATDDAHVIVRTQDGGQSWSVVHVASEAQQLELSCTEFGFCLAVLWLDGPTVVLASTDGTSWERVSTVEDVLGDWLPRGGTVTCISQTHCRIVAGNQVWGTTDGASWSAEQITDTGYRRSEFVGYTVDGNGLILGQTSASNPIVLRTVSQPG